MYVGISLFNCVEIFTDVFISIAILIDMLIPIIELYKKLYCHMRYKMGSFIKHFPSIFSFKKSKYIKVTVQEEIMNICNIFISMQMKCKLLSLI